MEFNVEKARKMIVSCKTYDQLLTVKDWFNRLYRKKVEEDTILWFDGLVGCKEDTMQMGYLLKSNKEPK